MNDTTAHLALPHLPPNHAQKRVRPNKAITRLDALLQLRVLSASLTAQRVLPGEGYAYLLPDGAGGADWDTVPADTLAAFADGAWAFITPGEGWQAFDLEGERALVNLSGSWRGMPAGKFSKLWTNTLAETTNLLAVRPDAELLTHDDVTPGGGDARKIIHTTDAADTGSVFFRTDFAGHAEIGLPGEDDFRLKVSPDDAAQTDVLRIARHR